MSHVLMGLTGDSRHGPDAGAGEGVCFSGSLWTFTYHIQFLTAIVKKVVH